MRFENLPNVMAIRGRRLNSGVAFIFFVLLFIWTTRDSFQPKSALSLDGENAEKEKPIASAPAVKERPLWAGWQNLESLFVFGDSWTSMDFKLEGEQPSLANPIGNPAFPGDVSSVGPNWAGFLTATYNASSVFTYNLGTGAATVARDVVPPVFPMTYTFEEQVRDKFVKVYAAQVKQSTDVEDGTERKAPASSDVTTGLWDPRTTLFAIWVGVVDIALLVRNHEELEITEEIFEKFAKAVDMVCLLTYICAFIQCEKY